MDVKTRKTNTGSDEGLTLETSTLESPYGGQFRLINHLIKPNFLVILPPTQHHSFIRNLLPTIIEILTAVSDDDLVNKRHLHVKRSERKK